MILSCKDKDFETVIQEYMNCSFENFENILELDIKEDKVASTEIEIIRELSLEEILEICIKEGKNIEIVEKLINKKVI